MDAIWQYQVAITLFFQALGNWLILPMKAISFLGQEEFFLVVMPAIYWCIDAGLGLRLGVMLVVTSATNGWLKMIFQAPRPYWFDRRVSAFAIETSFGMPSGHSQSAMAMWGLMAWARRYRWLGWLAGGVIFLTGISRIYLGVHFVDQVLVGWMVGAILIWLFVRLEPYVLNLIKRLSLITLVLVVLLISLGMVAVTVGISLGAGPLPVAWVANAQAAAPQEPVMPYDSSGLIALAGTWLGLGVGAAWDWRRHGPLAAGKTWQNQIVRYLVGLVGLLAVYLGLKLIFPGSQDLISSIFRYIRYALVGLWVTALAPAVFRRVRLV